MTKSELIKKIHSQNNYNYQEIQDIVTQTLDLIALGLAYILE